MFSFATIERFAALGLVLLLCGCPPPDDGSSRRADGADGTYLAEGNKLFDSEAPFDLRWTVVYPEREEGFNPELGISNRELTMARCTWCHECGFKDAFDYARYQSMEWKPRYVGEQWADPVRRMEGIDETMLNEHVATRSCAMKRWGSTTRARIPRAALRSRWTRWMTCPARRQETLPVTQLHRRYRRPTKHRSDTAPQPCG
jgi:hypothetical protein